MQAQIIPNDQHPTAKDKSPVAQFFINIETMVKQGNRQETVVYFSMLFSLVIWVIAFISLFLSVLFYVFFLWHYVPKSDGSLTQYCRRKIESRLERIVSKKIKKALEKQEMKRKKEERDAIKKGGEAPRGPTLPKLNGMDDDASSIISGMTGHARSDTMSTVGTLPSYSNGPSRTNTMSTTRTAAMRQPTLPSLSERPGPTRSDTQGTAFSTTSYGSNAPLLGGAGDMGMASPLPPMPEIDRNAEYFSAPMNNRPPPNGMPGRPYPPMQQQGRSSPFHQNMPPRVDTSFGGRTSPPQEYRNGTPVQGNASYPNRRPVGPPRNGQPFSPYDNRAPDMGPAYEMSPVDVNAPSGQQDYFGESTSPQDYQPPQMPSILRPGSPAMSQQSAMPPRAGTAPPPRVGTAPPSNPRAGLPATLQSAIQRREASQPLANRNMPQTQQRSATAPVPQQWVDPTGRSQTTSPSSQGYNPGYNPY